MKKLQSNLSTTFGPLSFQEAMDTTGGSHPQQDPQHLYGLPQNDSSFGAHPVGQLNSFTQAGLYDGSINRVENREAAEPNSFDPALQAFIDVRAQNMGVKFYTTPHAEIPKTVNAAQKSSRIIVTLPDPNSIASGSVHDLPATLGTALSNLDRYSGETANDGTGIVNQYLRDLGFGKKLAQLSIVDFKDATSIDQKFGKSLQRVNDNSLQRGDILVPSAKAPAMLGQSEIRIVRSTGPGSYDTLSWSKDDQKVVASHVKIPIQIFVQSGWVQVYRPVIDPIEELKKPISEQMPATKLTESIKPIVVDPQVPKKPTEGIQPTAPITPVVAPGHKSGTPTVVMPPKSPATDGRPELAPSAPLTPVVEVGPARNTHITFYADMMSGNTAPYQTISQRNDFYVWAHQKLDGKSKWFGAADIVTRGNAVGSADADKINGPILTDAADRFLRAGNKYLFTYNVDNAKLILNGTLKSSFVDTNGQQISFDGLTAKKLDYALVQFEQTKVQEFIVQYKKENPTADMEGIIKSVSGSFEKHWFPPVELAKNSYIKAIMREKFNDGKTFDFSSYSHRVLLGQLLIDHLYAE